MLHYIVSAILVLNIFFVITVVFFERKNPSSSMAWILLLLFVPLVSFFLYLFLGTGFRFRKRKIYAKKSALDISYETQFLQQLEKQNSRHVQGINKERIPLLHYLESEGDGYYTDDNSIEVFTDGNELFDRLLADINSAKEHIHLLYYIFKSDMIGKKIIDALCKKAKEGVEVRLIYDGIGSMLSFGSFFKELRKDGGLVKIFSPMFGKISSSLNINYRNHRKIVVVDGKVAYVGGMNVGDEYMGRNSKLCPWRDTHCRITGSAVWFLQERFFMDWSHVIGEPLKDLEGLMKYFPPPIQKGYLGVQVVSSGPDIEDSPIKGGLLRMFYEAKKTLYIQTPYFAPDESIMDALKVAVRSGVDVRLMIPILSDRMIVHKATMGYAKQMLYAGVRVFLYHGFLHAKTVEVDGKVASIGTTNLSNRSFNQNFEVNIFVHNSAFAEEQEEIFLTDVAHSTELTVEWFKKQSIINRFLYNSTRLLSPMI